MTIVRLQLASGLLSLRMKSNYTWIISVFVSVLRWYFLAQSWEGACQVPTCFTVFVYLGCLCSITGFIFILMFIFTLKRLQPSFFFPGCECKNLSVCRYMCNWAKTILKGDIRDGWITENLLKRDNPSCTLIRHTPWFSNGIFSIISAVTMIPSSHSAQLRSALLFTTFSFSFLAPFLSSLFLLLLACPWLCTNCKPFTLPW